jgi:hypothetical protein
MTKTLYATEVDGRLHWVFMVEMDGTVPRIAKIHRKPLAPKEEAIWRANPQVTILSR